MQICLLFLFPIKTYSSHSLPKNPHGFVKKFNLKVMHFSGFLKSRSFSKKTAEQAKQPYFAQLLLLTLSPAVYLNLSIDSQTV